MLRIKLLSSLHRVFPNAVSNIGITSLSAAQNEPLSFQAAFKLDGVNPSSHLVNVRTESDLPISTYLVGYVPVLHTTRDAFGPGTLPAPGLFPDMLQKKQTNPDLVYEGAPWGKRYFEKDEALHTNASCDSWQSVWFIINEDGQVVKPGTYPVTVKFEDSTDRKVLAEETLTVEIIPVSLIPQRLKYTNWFHCDCLADIYNTEIFSDRFFEIFRKWVHTAAKNGMNMLLTPCFTPPLDTPIDGERKTAQLVKVFRNNGKYTFDFTLLKKYIDIAREEGMENFEHSHLFTQWGAKAAPKVMATVDGVEKRIFGWDTDAAGAEYSEFLHAYLPEVTAFLRKEGLEKNTLFHLSDEPSTGMEESYAAARAVIGDLLDGFMVGDALSHYYYYEKGLVQTPICVTRDIHTFLGRCDNLWTYYTGGQINDGLSNRTLIMPPERNRVLGLEMFKFNILGFLQWGYNFYYDELCHGLYDPSLNPGGFWNNPGSCYCVYPGRNGECIQSISQKVFYEGINDMRALQTLEELKGRSICEEILRKHFGEISFNVVPSSPEAMLAFRADVNKALAD